MQKKLNQYTGQKTWMSIGSCYFNEEISQVNISAYLEIACDTSNAKYISKLQFQNFIN